MSNRHRRGTTTLVRRTAAALLVGVMGMTGASATAGAQTPPRPTAPGSTASSSSIRPSGWEVEVHGGTMIGSSPLKGSASATFTPGPSFTTEAGLPSRLVPSWYFGDGAALFNDVRDQFQSLYGESFSRITPLDGMFTTAAARRSGGASVGVRVRRVLSPRFQLEFGIERHNRAFTLTSEAASAIEATRASFESAFTGLLATVPQTGLRVTSTVQRSEPGGGQSLISGSLIVSLMRRGKLEAHAIAGAGVVRNGAHRIEVRLRGNYQFQVFGAFPINENDAATIEIRDRDQSPAGVFGGGITLDLSRRQGLRMDVRVVTSGNGVTMELSGTPAIVRTAPAAFLPSITTPSLQFSSATGINSTLGGSPVSGLRVFEGSGLDTRIQLSIGYVVRF